MLDHLFFDLDFETYKDALFEDQNYTSEQMKRTNSVFVNLFEILSALTSSTPKSERITEKRG